MHYLRVILDMCGACHFAAQLRDAKGTARILKLSPTGKLLFHGEDIYLHTRLVHGEQSAENQLVTHHIKHLRA